MLEGRLHAIRFAPDEWMDSLSINLWDEEKRAKLEVVPPQELAAIFPEGR